MNFTDSCKYGKKKRAKNELHRWLWSPMCRDGTIGINLIIGIKKCQELKNK